ncbi:MAG: M48 family metallopeptidase [Planctomycetota bacterium]
MYNVVGIIVALLFAENSLFFWPDSGIWSPAAAIAAPFVVLLVSRILTGPILHRIKFSELTARSQDMSDPAVRDMLMRESARIIKVIPKLKLGLQLAAMAAFVGVCRAGWPHYVVNTLKIPTYLHILPTVLPYLLAQMGTWPATIALDRRIGDARWTFGKYARFAWRMNLMTLAPMLILGTVYWSMLTFIPGFAELETAFKGLEQFGILLLLFPMSMILPAFIRYLIPSKPLPKGMLRSTLESYAKENGVKIRNIFVWKTGTSHFATAFVIGLVSPLRYVFITDALLKRASSEQVLAVFAHECGHVKHRHLWYLLGFLCFFALGILALPQVMSFINPPENAGWLFVGGAFVGMYHLFGYVSRRFERQADRYAAKTVGVEPLVSMFMQLAKGNPTAMIKDGWRHFSIGRRIRELEITERAPEVQRFFARELLRAKVFIVVLALTATALLVEPTRKSVYVGLTDWSFIKYDNARVSEVDANELDELRENAIDRARRIAEFGEIYELESRRVEYVIEALNGGGTSDLNNFIAELKSDNERESDPKVRNSTRKYIEFVEASERSVNRALALGTPFEKELAKEIDN